jgi:carbon-monoxide dehydrogenase medium subunit
VQISGLKGARSEPIKDFVQGQYQTSLTPDEVILGFEVPRPASELSWGVFKVARKSGAFANSIAFAISHGKGGPVSVVLAAAAPRPHLLQRVAQQISSGGTEDSLRAAIAEDVASLVPQDDSYLTRLHASTVLRAVREMQNK